MYIDFMSSKMSVLHRSYHMLSVAENAEKAFLTSMAISGASYFIQSSLASKSADILADSIELKNRKTKADEANYIVLKKFRHSLNLVSSHLLVGSSRALRYSFSLKRMVSDGLENINELLVEVVYFSRFRTSSCCND